MYKPLYFTEKECNNCTPSFSLSDVHDGVWIALDKARNRSGIPFVLNCGYRSVAWDKSRGRSGTSYHTKGLAVDIRCRSSATRYKIVEALLEYGFTGIGIYPTFIHADMRSEPIIFIGEGR